MAISALRAAEHWGVVAGGPGGSVVQALTHVIIDQVHDRHNMVPSSVGRNVSYPHIVRVSIFIEIRLP